MARIGKYEIIDQIGRGGFAIVYQARDTELDRIVALKALHPHLIEQDPLFAERFLQEAQVAARLHHPHIVTIYEVGEVAGQHYLAMAYLSGKPLSELLAAESFAPERTVKILGQIAGALDTIHSKGLVHRDIKPANIMVDEAGQATLLDFGIVRAVEGTKLTLSMTILGTPEYMAPEQAEIDPDVPLDWRADIYALGVVAYELLVGRLPFTGRTPTAVLYKHVHETPPAPLTFNPKLLPGLSDPLLKALAKAPQERFQQAGAFVAALKSVLQQERQLRQQEATLAPLYQRLKSAAAQDDWPAVLTLGGRIQALDPNYQDVPVLIEEASRQIRRAPTQKAKPSYWLWLAGGGLLLCLLLSGGAYAFFQSLSSPALTGNITPIQTLPIALESTSPPTPLPSEVSPSATAAPSPETPPPEMTATATATPSSSPTLEPTVPDTATSPPSTATPLPPPTDTPLPPTPTPVAGRIAFESDRSGKFQIYTMNPDGTEIGCLTCELTSENGRPIWSPDGQRLAFMSDEGSSAGVWDIYVMDADGSGRVRLTKTPDSQELFPTWSPDGSQIAFSSDQRGNFEIYVMSALDGSQLKQLTNRSGIDRGEDWSPDGAWIAFQSDQTGNFDIYLMSASEGSQIKQLTSAPGNEGSPAWSPDGSRLAFNSTGDSDSSDIFVMQSDGNGLIRLTNNGGDNTHAVWSPDGKNLVFESDFGGNYDIYVIQVDSGNLPTPLRLTEDPATDQSASWAWR